MSVRGEDGLTRRATSRRSILATTAEVLIERGYTDLTIDEIALRSGVAKTTIYRHFPGKPDLILGVVLDAFSPLADSQLDGDDHFVGVIKHLSNLLGDPLIRQALMVVLAEAPRHPELLARLRADFIDPERARIAEQVALMQEQWPTGVDPALAFDVVGGALLFRLSFGDGPIDDRYIGDLLTLLLGPVHDQPESSASS
jgi:AcrR family transcriptional regulator